MGGRTFRLVSVPFHPRRFATRRNPSSSEFFQTTDRGLNEAKGDEPRPLDSAARTRFTLCVPLYRFLFLCMRGAYLFSGVVIELRRNEESK